MRSDVKYDQESSNYYVKVTESLVTRNGVPCEAVIEGATETSKRPSRRSEPFFQRIREKNNRYKLFRQKVVKKSEYAITLQK